MQAKRVLIIAAALLMASQAYALTAYEKNHGCNHEVGDCPDQGGGGGGGGGDYGPSGFVGSVDRNDGSTIDFYSDSGGDWWVVNNADGTSQVGWEDSAGPKQHKKIPKAPGIKRPKYQKSEMTAAAKKTLAAEQAAAKAAAAKSAADKAFQEKMAAQDAADNKAAADKAKAEAAVRSNKAGTGQSLTKAPQPQVSASSPQRKP